MTEDLFHLGVKALIRNAKGDILLLQVNPAKLNGQRASYWDLPGGRVQKGQTVATTLQREVAEETGILTVGDVKPMGMVLSNIRIPLGDGESVGLILSIYSCSIDLHSLITISDEHLAYDWFSPLRAADLLAVKYPADFCQLIREHQER